MHCQRYLTLPRQCTQKPQFPQIHCIWQVSRYVDHSRGESQVKFLTLETAFSSWAFYNIFVDSLLLSNFHLLQRFLFSLIKSKATIQGKKKKELKKKIEFLHGPSPFMVGEKKGWPRREGQYEGAGRLRVGSRRHAGEQAQGDTSSSSSSSPSSSPPSSPLSCSLFKA